MGLIPGVQADRLDLADLGDVAVDGGTAQADEHPQGVGGPVGIWKGKARVGQKEPENRPRGQGSGQKPQPHRGLLLAAGGEVPGSLAAWTPAGPWTPRGAEQQPARHPSCPDPCVLGALVVEAEDGPSAE